LPIGRSPQYDPVIHLGRGYELIVLWELFVSFWIVAACVLIHVVGMVVLFHWLMDQKDALEEEARLVHTIRVLLVVFGIIIFLHMLETTIWAVFFDLRELFPDFETSLYFSLTSYSTSGFGDVVLPKTWRILGGIEAISGVLLCGLSTGFIFVILTALLQIRRQHHVENQAAKQENSQ
jgi:hypothetical protein